MAQFFCPQTNTWVNAGCTYKYTPAPAPPTVYPVFDPSINTWITSGNYGQGAAVIKPYFSFLTNSWVTS